MSFQSFSQKQTLVGKDSCIAFTIPQSKILLTYKYKLETCELLTSISNIEIDSLETLVSTKNQLLSVYEEELKLCIFNSKKDSITISNNLLQITDLKSSQKKQKRKNLLATIIGSLTSLFLGYMSLLK